MAERKTDRLEKMQQPNAFTGKKIQTEELKEE